VYYEQGVAMGGIPIELERIYSMMRLNMAVFAPWMNAQSAKIYIYAGESSYLAGEFNPPKWSKGLAFPSKKTVVVFASGSLNKLKSTITHELSHVYFEGFYAEKNQKPQQWLNEGLAVYMENKSLNGEGEWGMALENFPDDMRLSFPDFFYSDVNKIDDSQRISYWYLQAFGIITYLYDTGDNLKFKNFCEEMRSGKTAETALWDIYRIRGASGFSQRWNAWLQTYKNGGNSGRTLEFQSPQISSSGFTQFDTGRAGSKNAVFENRPSFRPAGGDRHR